MKLVIAGATGFVATELIRQSLSNPKITSVIALARRLVSTPSNLGPNADSSKLRSVLVENYGSYPDDVIEQLAGVDACIWYVRYLSSFLYLMHLTFLVATTTEQPVPSLARALFT